MQRNVPLVAVHSSDVDSEAGARVVTLIDGSRATEEPLRRAISIAGRGHALLTIAAYLPGGPRPDDRRRESLEDALIAAQAEAEVEGVAAECCLLLGPHPLTQLQALVSPAPSLDTVVLCSPVLVGGPLRALARSVLREPPCTLHVVTPPAGWRSRLLGWLARRGGVAR